MIDVSALSRAGNGPDLDEVRVTRRMLRAIADEIVRGRTAMAQLAQRGRVAEVLLDISGTPS